MMPVEGSGRRERKKQATRQRISDVATMLFAVRGFDSVSVAEIAAAADVSKMTVFNHFARKEDLLFDRNEEARSMVTEALRSRPPGEPVLLTLRRLLLDLLAQRHPLSGLRDGAQAFWLIVMNSPTLQARARQLVEELETLLRDLFAEAAATTDDDLMPALIASLGVAAWRAVYLTSARRLLAGESTDAIYADQVALVDRAFDLVERAAGDFGARTSSGHSLMAERGVR
jgi:AcrR family transcriptional regulator